MYMLNLTFLTWNHCVVLNYISEGSVSISIVLFVANPLDSIMFTLIVHPAQSPLLRALLS